MKKIIKNALLAIGALAVTVAVSTSANKLVTNSNSFSTLKAPITSSTIIHR